MHWKSKFSCALNWTKKHYHEWLSVRTLPRKYTNRKHQLIWCNTWTTLLMGKPVCFSIFLVKMHWSFIKRPHFLSFWAANDVGIISLKYLCTPKIFVHCQEAVWPWSKSTNKEITLLQVNIFSPKTLVSVTYWYATIRASEWLSFKKLICYSIF